MPVPNYSSSGSRLHSCKKTKIKKMKFSGQSNYSIVFTTWVLLLLLYSSNSVAAKKSRHPISDNEIRLKKNQCYEDIESGLWGQRCMSSRIAKENCALRCLSPICYELVYESDPLEEGERDFVRSQEYKYCMHKDSLGESLDGIRGVFD